jgi:asparagine synthetase B (glutamine-hydrolysing)
MTSRAQIIRQVCESLAFAGLYLHTFLLCERLQMDAQKHLGIPYNYLPGWLAIAGETDPSALQAHIRLGLDAFLGYDDTHKIIHTDEHFGFGLFTPDTALPLTTWSFFANSDYIGFIEGIFYDAYEGYTPANGEDARLAERIVKKFTLEAFTAIEKINGSFSGCIYNKNSKRLITFIDRLGTKVLYWSHIQNYIVISSTLFGLKNLKKFSLDTTSAFQFITLGFPIGVRTLLDGVFLQPPATAIIFHNNKTETKRYWKTPQRLRHMSLQEAAENINASMERLAKRIYDKAQGIIALGMTGGHDSRLVFSALVHSNTPFECVRWNEGNFNDKIVQQLCSLEKKQPIIVRPISGNELLDIRKDAFIYSDGNYLYSSGFSRLAMESSERRMSLLMLGFSGDRISGSLTLPAPQYLKNIDNLARVSLKNHMELVSFQDATSLLKNSRNDTLQETLFEWNKSFTQEEALENMEDISIWQLINNRNLKRIRYQMNPAGRYVQVIYPYLDVHVLQAYFSLPIPLLHHQRAHCYASFYRNANYGRYQATGYPVSLKMETFFPLSLYVLRLTTTKFWDISSIISLKSKESAWSSWEEGVLAAVLDTELFSREYIKKLHSRQALKRNTLLKLHTLKMFYDVFVGDNEIAFYR